MYNQKNENSQKYAEAASDATEGFRAYLGSCFAYRDTHTQPEHLVWTLVRFTANNTKEEKQSVGLRERVFCERVCFFRGPECSLK